MPGEERDHVYFLVWFLHFRGPFLSRRQLFLEVKMIDLTAALHRIQMSSVGLQRARRQTHGIAEV